MRIDLNITEETVLLGFHGGRGETSACMVADGNSRIMRGRLTPGASIGDHCHDDSSEILYILQGRGQAALDGEVENWEPGICHYCPKEHTHSLENNGGEDLIFFAVAPRQ